MPPAHARSVDPSGPRSVRSNATATTWREHHEQGRLGHRRYRRRLGLSKAEVGRVIDAAINTVRETVVEGDRVTLADFGTFERKHRNRRIARNPRQPDVPIVVP